MVLEIDQSGKIEQTNKNTILCLSNKKWYALFIPARVKRQIQEIFRRNGQVRNFVLFTFCAGLALLLKEVKPKAKVIIDEEYYGKGAIIKNILQELLSKMKHLPIIEFRRIGKRSSAHILAKEVALRHKKPRWTVNTDQLIKQIKMTEVGKRLKNA